MEKKRISVTICLLLLALLMTMAPLAFAGNTSTGSVIIGNVAPTVTVSSIWNSADAVNENNTVLSVWVEYHINYTISDGNSLLDIANSTLQIWDSGGSGIVQGSADSNMSHYTFQYINSTDVWSEVGPGPTNAHIITADCSQPGTKTGTSGTYKLAFKLDYTANYTLAAGVKSWKVAINATDSAGNLATGNTIIFGVAFYYSTTVVDTTHSWSPGSLPQTNMTLTAPAYGYINITVTSNGVWTLQAEGSGDLSDGLGHTITLGNIVMHLGTLGSATALTTGYTSVGGVTSQAAGSGIATHITLWISINAGQAAGTYTYTLSVQAIAVN